MSEVAGPFQSHPEAVALPALASPNTTCTRAGSFMARGANRDPMSEEIDIDADDSLERALGRAWSSDRPWNLLTRLTELPNRMGGSPGERRAAELVREEFESIGLADVRTAEFPMARWERGETELAVTDPVERSFRAIALPYSPAGDVEGPIVDVGYGTPEEIEDAGEALDGAIALSSTTTPPGRRFVHRMETFGHVAAAGAAGFLFANHVSGQLPPTGSLRFDGEAAIPGVGVSREAGDWLAEYAERAGRGRLRVEATTTEGTSRNVHGTLGGGDEEIVLLAHYDAHDVGEGALDNGCGVAVVGGAAAILAPLELDCRVRVAAVGCEEVGLIGAEALAEELDLDAVRAVVNVDGAGRFRNLKAYSHASDAIADLAESVGEAFGQPVLDEPDPHPFSDHWPFLRAGVPSLQLHSEREGDERGRGWGHTEADTREKVDPRNLREHAMLAALLVSELTRADPPRVPDDVLRAALADQEYEPGMRAADIWPADWT